MLYLKVRDDYRIFADALKNRIPFTTRAELTGFVPDGDSYPLGRLPAEWRTQIRADRPDYIIASFSTPIAWHSPIGDRWVIADVHYSHSTLCHQHKITDAIRHFSREA